MANTNYVPGQGGLPFGNRNTNPQGSFYGSESEYSPAETDLIRKAIYAKIFDAAPAQFDSLKVAFSKDFEDVLSDEHEYKENTFGRSPIISAGNVAAQAASPGAHQTQTIPLTAPSLLRVSADLIVIYPDGTHGVVTAISGNNATVNSLTNAGLPAVVTGDVFAIQSTIRADGMDYISNYERLDVVTRYNYVQFFMRAQRWTPVEMQKYINLGTTDYMERDKEQKMKQLRVDIFNSFWNGQRGEYTISNGHVAKAMGGVYPTMIAAGAANPTTTVAGLQSTFEATAFSTNFKVEGGTRFIYGTDETLNEFSKIYKQPGLRYAPNDQLANLNLKYIELGTMKFVLVPCELWREESCFSSDWARRVIVLDQESVQPVKMKGIPAMWMNETNDMQKGEYRDWTDYWVAAQFSIRFHNPPGSFIINIL